MRRPETARFQTAVWTVSPCHAISFGRPTLTDNSRPTTVSVMTSTRLQGRGRAQIPQHEGAAGNEHVMERHAPSILERTDHDSMRVASFDQRTDGEAQLVYAIRAKKRAEQRRTSFTEYLSEPALRERVEHDAHVECLLSTDDHVGNTGERFFLHGR